MRSKAFIMERERFDGADVAHLLQAGGHNLDWHRLLDRFGPHWRVLFSHLVLFGYIYPGEQSRIPSWVLQELIGRLQDDRHQPHADERLCRGTLLSSLQYLPATIDWGYADARLPPHGTMSQQDYEQWTAREEKPLAKSSLNVPKNAQ